MLLKQASIPKVGQPSAKPTYHLSLPPAWQSASPPAILSPHLSPGQGSDDVLPLLLEADEKQTLPDCTDHGVPGVTIYIHPWKCAISPCSLQTIPKAKSCCHNSPCFATCSDPKIQQPDQWFPVYLIHGGYSSLRVSMSVWPGGPMSIP